MDVQKKSQLFFIIEKIDFENFEFREKKFFFENFRENIFHKKKSQGLLEKMGRLITYLKKLEPQQWEEY